MANAEIPTGRQAVRAWKRLDPDVRKDVWRRACQGMGYPDPAVAAIAIGRARYTRSVRIFVWYWGVLFVVITGVAIGLSAVLDRVTGLGPLSYVLAIIISFINGATGYAKARRDAKQLEEASMNTLRTGHTDHGS